MTGEAQPYWRSQRVEAVVFTHVEDDVHFVWVNGVWLELDEGRVVPGICNLDDALDADAAERVGWAFLDESEREALDSAAGEW